MIQCGAVLFYVPDQSRSRWEGGLEGRLSWHHDTCRSFATWTGRAPGLDPQNPPKNASFINCCLIFRDSLNLGVVSSADICNTPSPLGSGHDVAWPWPTCHGSMITFGTSAGATEASANI